MRNSTKNEYLSWLILLLPLIHVSVPECTSPLLQAFDRNTWQTTSTTFHFIKFCFLILFIINMYQEYEHPHLHRHNHTFIDTKYSGVYIYITLHMLRINLPDPACSHFDSVCNQPISLLQCCFTSSVNHFFKIKSSDHINHKCKHFCEHFYML